MIRRAIQFALGTIIVMSGYVLAQTVLMPIHIVAAPPAGNEIVMTLDSACPNGTSEVADLDTKFLRGTVAAHSDVGGTGGNDSVTPSGTNSTSTVTPLGTVAAPVVSWPAGVPTFAGAALGTHNHTWTGDAFSGVINHTHTVTVTDPGHTHVEQYNSATTGPNTGWTTVDTSSNTPTAVTTTTASATTGITASTANPGGGVSSITPTGTNTAITAGTPAGTVAWPAGVPTTAAPAFTGSSSTVGAQVFTGSSADNKPAYTKVIFCQRALIPVPQPPMMASGMFVGGLWGFVALRRRPLRTGVSS